MCNKRKIQLRRFDFELPKQVEWEVGERYDHDLFHENGNLLRNHDLDWQKGIFGNIFAKEGSLQFFLKSVYKDYKWMYYIVVEPNLFFTRGTFTTRLETPVSSVAEILAKLDEVRDEFESSCRIFLEARQSSNTPKTEIETVPEKHNKETK